MVTWANSGTITPPQYTEPLYADVTIGWFEGIHWVVEGVLVSPESTQPTPSVSLCASWS